MRRAFAFFGLSVLAIVVLAAVAPMTPPGRAVIAGMIERAASGNGISVSIDHLSGWAPFRLGANRIVVSDTDGPFAEIDGLDVDVRVTALIAGRLAFDEVAANRVAALRRPNLPGGGTGGVLLPFTVEHVSVARLELSEALAGRPAVLTLIGSFAGRTDGSIAATVNAERTDGPTGSLAATIRRSNADAPLAIDVTLEEAADGILVGLMGRPSGPGYALATSTGLTDGTLEGEVSLSSEGKARLNGRFGLSPAGDGRRLVLTGDGDLGELVPPDFADLLSGPIRVAIDADWATAEGVPLPRIVIHQGEIATASVRASASGALGDAAADLSITVEVAKPGGGTVVLPLPGARSSLERLWLSGTVAPSGDVIRLEVIGRIAGLETGEVRIPAASLSLAAEARQDDPLAGGRLPFALRVEADAIETPMGRLAATAEAPLTLTADGTFDTGSGAAETDARLTAAEGTARFTGRVAADGLDGGITADFADIAPLSSLAGRPVGGAVRLEAEGTLAQTESEFTVRGAVVDLDPGEAMLARLLDGTTTFSGTVRRQSGDSIKVADFTIAGAALDVRGAFSLDAGMIEAALDGSLTDLARLAETVGGAATFTARASGPLVRPEVEATIAVEDGNVLDQSIENATISLNDASTDDEWRAALTLEGNVAGGPLSGTAVATVDRESGALAFPEVDLAVGPNRITGAVERTAAGPLAGALSVEAPEVRTLAALALIEATGSGRADIRFLPDDGAQALTIAFSGRDVGYGPLAAAEIGGEVRVDDAFGTPLVRGSASASAMTVGGVRLDRAEATAVVEDGATRFEAAATGPDLDLTGTGVYSGAEGAPVVRLDTLTGSLFEVPVRVEEPVVISLDGGESRLAAATLTLGGGTVRIEGAVAPQLDLTITLDNVAASVANSLAPGLDAEGTITGRLRVTGSLASPAITWQADWTGLATAATRNVGLPALTLAAQGEATRDATNIDATLSGAGVSLAIDGRIAFAGPGLDLSARGTLPLALLALRSDRELRLAGDAQVDVSIRGSLAAPLINGTIDLVEATFADVESGFGVAGASGRITFDGQQATVEQISGRLTQGGEITITGTAQTDTAGLPVDLTLRIANGRYSDGSIVDATLDADLAITGPLLGNGTVSGRVDLGRTEIRLSDRLGSSATAIDVRHVNAPAAFTPPTPPRRPADTGGASSGAGGLALDVTLAGNSGVFVRGFGIDAEVGGALLVEGTTGSPRATGGLELQRGRIEVLGRRFDLTRGTLTFAGNLVPFVDFAATTRTSDAVVTLNVVGPANDLEIRFTSSPQMPEEEILSRLLFERSVGTLSPLQAVQLVDAVAQLTGAAAGGGIVTRIRQATGLDDLDIRQSATGGTTVGVGRRVGENVRLGVEAGTADDSGRVVIDLDITERLKARGEAGQDGTGKVGLTYEWEY